MECEVDTSTTNKHTTLREIFCENEPFYLSIGMKHEDYWYNDPFLARTYLRAFNISQKREFNSINTSNWILGHYVESAVASVMSNIGSKRYVSTYPDKPIGLIDDEEEKKANEEKAKQEEQQKALDWLLFLSQSLDKQFNDKGSE